METVAVPTHSNTDLDIEAEVTRAIYDLDNVRSTRSELVISATRGQVLLTGYVPTPMIAAEIERAARSVPGVAGVTNQLVDDADLSRRVAEALATDPRTRGIPPGYEVASAIGYVTVVGDLDEAQSAAVLEVGQGVDGVRAMRVRPLS
ncbi:MAG: BON domain-containing protein [Anaerolineales bacterium]